MQVGDRDSETVSGSIGYVISTLQHHYHRPEGSHEIGPRPHQISFFLGACALAWRSPERRRSRLGREQQQQDHPESANSAKAKI